MPDEVNTAYANNAIVLAANFVLSISIACYLYNTKYFENADNYYKIILLIIIRQLPLIIIYNYAVTPTILGIASAIIILVVNNIVNLI